MYCARCRSVWLRKMCLIIVLLCSQMKIMNMIIVNRRDMSGLAEFQNYKGIEYHSSKQNEFVDKKNIENR